MSSPRKKVKMEVMALKNQAWVEARRQAMFGGKNNAGTASRAENRFAKDRCQYLILLKQVEVFSLDFKP